LNSSCLTATLDYDRRFSGVTQELLAEEARRAKQPAAFVCKDRGGEKERRDANRSQDISAPHGYTIAFRFKGLWVKYELSGKWPARGPYDFEEGLPSVQLGNCAVTIPFRHAAELTLEIRLGFVGLDCVPKALARGFCKSLDPIRSVRHYALRWELLRYDFSSKWLVNTAVLLTTGPLHPKSGVQPISQMLLANDLMPCQNV